MKRTIIYLILTMVPSYAQVDYYTQVQTIFNDNCISCHINGGAYYGGLDLANYDSLIVGSHNGDVVIPGDHASSILWQEISSGDMPPGNSDELSTEEIELIAQWIDEGALETAILTDPCDLGIVYVSEAHTSGDPEDYIELFNSGDTDCSLEGFQLDNSEDLEDLTFEAVIIPAGGYWTGYEDEDSSFSSGLNVDGDIIVFADPDNNSLIVTLGESQELDGVELSQSFDANGVGCYTNPTPGAANGDCITLGNSTDLLLPRIMILHQNYPNPFNPVTTISYELSKDAIVNISVYDMNGNLVKNLLEEGQGAGHRSVQWNATNQAGQSVSAGVYLYSIEVDGLIQTKKMILLK